MQACAIYHDTAPEDMQYKIIELKDNSGATKLELLVNAEEKFEIKNIAAIVFGENLSCVLNEE